MRRHLIYGLAGLAVLLVLALSWYGWASSGLNLLQLGGFIC